MAIFSVIFASRIFSEPRAAGFRPASHHVCKYMADIHSAAAEIRRGKKEEERKKEQTTG